MIPVFTLAAWLLTGLAIASNPQLPEGPCEQEPANQILLDDSSAESWPFEVQEAAEALAGGDGTRTGECLGGGCSGGIAYSGTTYTTTSPSFMTVAPGISPGEYAFCGVASGFTYEWSLCSGSDGGIAPYDSVLTLRNQSGSTAYCASDNFCGDAAKIRWTATFTGTVRILVFENFEGFCNTDFSFSSTLRWRREGAICANGSCESGETDCNCPQDCDPACGDGCCTGNEVPCNCASDCGPPASEDCNDNNTSDECDIAGGTSQDVNPANGIPDECEGGNLTSAFSRKSNPGGSGGVCDLPIDLDFGTPDALITSDARIDSNDLSLTRGITHLVINYDGPPGPTPVTLVEDASCPSPPAYGPYTGISVMNCVAAGNVLTCAFTPGLENARTYRLAVPHGAATTDVEVRSLIGDLNSDGRVNAVDRSGVVGIWTSPGFSCATDIDNDGRTNAADRSLAVGSWTSPARNCAP